MGSRLEIPDRPSGIKDPVTMQEVKQSILHSRDAKDETFIVVSHDMDFGRETCDRPALMRNGTIIGVGQPVRSSRSSLQEKSAD